MSLPDTNGLALAVELRAELGARCPPLLAYSAHAMTRDIQAATRGGFADHLVKPATVQTVLAAIDRFLEPAQPVLAMARRD